MKYCVFGYNPFGKAVASALEAGHTGDTCVSFADADQNRPESWRPVVSLSEIPAQLASGICNAVCIPDEARLFAKLQAISQLLAMGVPSRKIHIARKAAPAGRENNCHYDISPLCELDEPLVYLEKDELRVAIYATKGGVVQAEYLYHLVTTFFQNVQVIGLCSDDPEARGQAPQEMPVYTLEEVKQQCDENSLDGIVMCTPVNTSNVAYGKTKRTLLRTCGTVYGVPFTVTERLSLRREDLLSIFTRVENLKQLRVIQVLTTGHCNMNCNACSHFSSLCREPVYYPFASYQKDIARIHTLGLQVKSFSFMGGEPLLNTELDKFLDYTATLFPESGLVVASNGLLVPQMDLHLIQTIKKHRVSLLITHYPLLTEEKIRQIRAFLDGHAIQYRITSKATHFETRLYALDETLEAERTFGSCDARFCHTLRDGRLGNCYMPLTINYFNDYFQQSFPNDPADTIDLYAQTTTAATIVKRIEEPNLLCRYCGGSSEVRRLSWARVEHPANINDWLKIPASPE